MAEYKPTDAHLAALERCFSLAEGHGGGALRMRKLLCAWWNATELGGFDFADFWSLDAEHLFAASKVIAMIATLPQGTYADSIPGFGERMRSLALRRAAELRLEKAREHD